MTNETVQAATGVTDTLCQGFNEQLTQGQELWQQALQWLTDKGLTFAINLISAIVILVLGTLAIKLIVSAVGKAVERLRREGFDEDRFERCRKAMYGAYLQGLSGFTSLAQSVIGSVFEGYLLPQLFSVLPELSMEECRSFLLDTLDPSRLARAVIRPL